jgi:hypothetical protein
MDLLDLLANSLLQLGGRLVKLRATRSHVSATRPAEPDRKPVALRRRRATYIHHAEHRLGLTRGSHAHSSCQDSTTAPPQAVCLQF